MLVCAQVPAESGKHRGLEAEPSSDLISANLLQYSTPCPRAQRLLQWV